jgi:uncharacterized protein YggE
MKKLFLIAALCCAFGAAKAQDIKAFQYEDAIQVNGQAERKVTPDEIFVAITVKDTDNKLLGVNGLETRMRSEFSALGIDVANNLKVVSVANAPRRRHQVDTSRSYELKVGNTRTLNSVFESLGEMGVSEASVSRIGHSKIEALRGEVRIEAVKNAKLMAEQLASAVDQRVGPAVWIVDNGAWESAPAAVYRTRAMYDDYAENASGAMKMPPALDMQQITITANVTVKFVLKVF